MIIQIKTPRWALPLLKPCRYKGIKGGRGSGKSHFAAELLVEEHVYNPSLRSVCIREIQKSLKFSSKQIIEDKIKALGVSHLFDITLTEIRRRGGNAMLSPGIIIFQGMQDHTADSIKSLEGFDRAWVEEAQSMSARSMSLLLPTIRKDDSEIWFTWNPERKNDAVERLFANGDDDIVCVHINYTENPFCPKAVKKEAERHKKNDPDTFDHVWLGAFNIKNEAQIFNGKFESYEFDVPDANPIFGLDWGFSQDPTAAVQCYIADDILYIYKEAGRVGLELDQTPDYIKRHLTDVDKYVIRADCARPESISYCKRKGLPKIQPCKKWAGSVEDGLSFMKSFSKIVIHPQCKETHQEFRLYSYKIDKETGDPLPDIVDKNNHYIDAIRYALGGHIKKQGFVFA